MFTSVTFFTSIDAVRGFAGEDYEQAVVEERPAGHGLPSFAVMSTAVGA